MHMADALLTPAVAGVMYAASAVVAGASIVELHKEEKQDLTSAAKKLPTMAVMSALVFAGQMINYTIPGTGSSGHLCGGLLLTSVLGPWAGFLSMIVILTIQCLFFADGGLLALGVLLLRDGPLCIRKPGSWRITSACLRNLWRVGTPLAAERAALSSAQVLLVRIVSGLGTVAIAANSLGVSAEGLCYMAGYGIQDASIALIGQAVGAHRRDMAKRFAWLCTMMGIGIMALSGVGLWLFAPALMGIFTADAAVIALGAQVLRIEAFAEPMFGASIVASGAMQGAGDSTGCFLLNLFSMWGVRLTLAFLLAPRLGLVGVWAAMCIELCIRGALFLIRLARGKWLDKGALQ